MDWTVIIAAAIGGGLLTQIFNYFATGRVDKMTKIQGVYEKTLDDVTERHDKEIIQRDKKISELEGQLQIRDALLDEQRQRQGELLVTIEDMKNTVIKVGDDVNKI